MKAPDVKEDDLKADFDNIITACLRDNSAKKSELLNSMKFVLLWKFIATIKLYAHSDLREYLDIQLTTAMCEHVKALEKVEKCEDLKKFVKILS